MWPLTQSTPGWLPAAIPGGWHQAQSAPLFPLGFKPAKSMVFAGLYPLSQEGFEPLRAALDRLTLNDASVTLQRETSVALGPGFRQGPRPSLPGTCWCYELTGRSSSRLTWA